MQCVVTYWHWQVTLICHIKAARLLTGAVWPPSESTHTHTHKPQLDSFSISSTLPCTPNHILTSVLFWHPSSNINIHLHFRYKHKLFKPSVKRLKPQEFTKKEKGIKKAKLISNSAWINTTEAGHTSADTCQYRSTLKWNIGHLNALVLSQRGLKKKKEWETQREGEKRKERDIKGHVPVRDPTQTTAGPHQTGPLMSSPTSSELLCLSKCHRAIEEHWSNAQHTHTSNP